MDVNKQFNAIIEQQLKRVEALKNAPAPVDFTKLEKVKIGFVDGDGVGPIITDSCRKVLGELLKDSIASGKIEFKDIEGLTIENRVEKLNTLPDEVLDAIKECNVFLKGPTMTPGKGDGLPELESANVALRKNLDLFANVRPVTVPEKNIDWVFFRENTEGEYALGSQGIDVSDDLAIDFKVITSQGTRRLAEAAFKYAKAAGNKNVTIITKANIMKKTDGKFLEICYDVAKKYSEIETDDLYVDICSAKLIDYASNSRFGVFILPNLYGDIITDEAAQIQGGVGTAGSANVGDRYAMFEAIHGSAPRMVKEGRGKYSNPSSMLRASVMMLRHIGHGEYADRLEKALDASKGKFNMTGRENGNTVDELTDFIIENL